MSFIRYDGVIAAATATPVTSVFSTANAENLKGSSLSDEFWGGNGDTLSGGLGDDTYFLNGPGIAVVESALGGIDKLVAWQSTNLAKYSQVENLKVSGDNIYGAGNAAANIIEGGDGAQQIYGGGGLDVLIGGAGRDTFIVHKGEGSDVIQDFSASDDVIRLKAGFHSFAQVQAAMSQQGADVKISFGGGEGLILRGVTTSQLSADNFDLEFDRSSLGQATFAEEFNNQLSIWDPESNPTGIWRPDYGYQGSQGYGSYVLANNGEKQVYTSPYFRDHAGDFAETPFVSNADGTLSIWARPSTNSEIFGFNYTSGLITTKPSFTQTYGYFEMKADIPETAGAWPAFWLLPADGTWPPEIDIMEVLGHDSSAVWTTRHSSAAGHHDAKGQENFVANAGDGMHTYGLLWTATDLVWYMDNVEVFRTTTPADMHKPMYMLANLALGGWAGQIDNSGIPAEFKIDYIRAYAAPGSSTGGAGAGAGSGAGGQTGGEQIPPPPASGAGLVLTSDQYADVLVGGAGADTLAAGQGPDVLTGGGGADSFVFTNLPWNAGHITDFQVGVDKLALSALLTAAGYTGADPLAAGHVILASDGAGGTKVYFDADAAGSVHQWPTLITTLDGVSPHGLTADKLFKGQAGGQATAPPATASQPGVVLTSDQYADVLTGGVGNDSLHAGQGPDTLTGGAGADRFVFANQPWNAGHVTDFKTGVDKLDLSALFDAAGYTGTNPVASGHLILVADGASTKVYFDADAAGTAHRWPTLITTLDGVATSALSSQDWII